MKICRITMKSSRGNYCPGGLWVGVLFKTWITVSMEGY